MWTKFFQCFTHICVYIHNFLNKNTEVKVLFQVKSVSVVLSFPKLWLTVFGCFQLQNMEYMKTYIRRCFEWNKNRILWQFLSVVVNWFQVLTVLWFQFSAPIIMGECNDICISNKQWFDRKKKYVLLLFRIMGYITVSSSLCIVDS